MGDFIVLQNVLLCVTKKTKLYLQSCVHTLSIMGTHCFPFVRSQQIWNRVII